MPTPPLSDEECRRVVALVRQHGTVTEAAIQTGEPRHKLRHRYEIARARGLDVDPAIAEAKAAVGTNLSPVLAWAKTKSEDGTSYSVLLRPEKENPEDALERIAAIMGRVVPVAPIPPPQKASADLLNFVPLFDVHMGMRVGSYGTAGAVKRLKAGFFDVIDRAPKAGTIVIVNGGDFTEANDDTALTPANKHPLAVDMDWSDIIDVAVDVTIELIEYAMRRANRVVYQALRANHDHATSVAIRQGLRQRYRDNPRFEMPDGHDVFTIEWKGNLLAAIHGHQKVSKPETLTLAIAARHAAAWGKATRRELWRGHNHKEITVNVPGMRVHQVNPICPPGRYANENLFTGESDIQCVTYRAGGGRSGVTVHIFDDTP